MDAEDPALEGEGLAAPTGPVEAILQRALPRAEEGAWDEAAELLREGLEEHAGDPYLLCWLGMAERELGMEGIAYERFRRALEANPRDPVLLATAGNAIAAFDDPSAEIALRTAALLAPTLPQARWMYGAYLAREGMSSEALEHLGAAAELDSEDPVIRMELGVARALAGDLAGASYDFARAVEMDPDDAWGLILLGLVEVHMGELESAARTLEEGARMCPDDLDAQLLAALALAATDWEDRAIEMLERARLHAQGAESGMVAEVEGAIEDGPEPSRRFLSRTLGPTSFRDRLTQRP